MDKRQPMLVIDDDEETLELISTVLEEEGYAVDTAANSSEAMDLCSQKCYALLLIDLFLPDTNGLQLIKKIYNTEPRIRKVVITGYPSLDNAIEALNLGVDAYLTKPINMSELLQVVSEQIDEYEEELKDRYPVFKDI